ncbi:peroxisomal multifunctional enzyme type 2-like [Arctopsyche grandis]|uniref:peroxisomal multifunctional enzyme type 2-like n=1 Tax=Arctopsyche grandis TaxID=121162 RepID=UPI00406D984A
MGLRCEAVIEKVKAKVAAADPNPANRKILSVFEFNVTVGGKEVKKYTIDLKVLEVYEGAYKGGAPDVTVVVDDEFLEKMLKKEVTLEEAKAAGKISASGDSDAITKLKLLTQKLTE